MTRQNFEDMVREEVIEDLINRHEMTKEKAKEFITNIALVTIINEMWTAQEIALDELVYKQKEKEKQ